VSPDDYDLMASRKVSAAGRLNGGRWTALRPHDMIKLSLAEHEPIGPAHAAPRQQAQFGYVGPG
jgi:hypothetical protein